MEIKVKKDGKEYLVQAGNPKGKHTKKAFKLLCGMETEGKEFSAIEEYTTYLDKIAVECCTVSDGKESTSMNMEWLDNLEDEEKNKIIVFFQEKVQGKFDFMKSSLKQPSIAPTDTDGS